MTNKIRLLTCLLILSSAAFSQQDTLVSPADTTRGDQYEVFLDVDPANSEEPLKLEIKFNYRDFLKMKYRDTSLQADLSVYDHDILLYSQPVKISARGESRKKICFFPPFALDFKKSDPASKYADQMGKFKFVTQCKNNKISEQYLVKEYLCYKLLNILTDYSYRVRIVEIKFIDTAGKIKEYTNYGFIIETNDHLADRISAYPVEIQGIRMKQTDYDAVHLMTVYQFMIGNTDWDVPSLHNIKLYKLQDYTKINPVPITYDFDYAGVVNADYAVPHVRFGTTSVRERVYMGYCIPASEFNPVFNKFLEKEEQLYSIISNCIWLDKFNKSDMLNYLGEFFEIIKSPKSSQVNIINRCFEE